MSISPGSDEPLRFDRADFGAEAPVGVTCGVCAAAIADHYYETAGKVVCEPCRDRMEAAFNGGSRIRRFAKATLLGSIAAAIGAAGYYAVVKLTDYNIGLIAIVIGVMVGAAVRAGSGGRGGRLYQFLALFLTYTAIAGMLTPFLFSELAEQQKQERRQQEEEINAIIAEVTKRHADKEAPADAPQAAAEPQLPEAPNADTDADAEETDDADADLAEADFDAAVRDPLPAPAAFALGLAVLVAICYSLPVMVAIDSPMSGLIFGFGLWEAWRVNRKATLTFNGPYHVVSIIRDDEAEVPGGGDRHDA